jgi:glycine/D-amino acid oxidase-like deaminating enzyme
VTSSADVVVIGAGAVGAACAYYLADAGLGVVVVERGSVAGGTTGAGEGNLLVSDKVPGPELDLALLSLRLWRDLPPELRDRAELIGKGGLVVADSPADLGPLNALASSHRAAGVTADPVGVDDLHALEPAISPDLAGGVFYPEDMQVQPMLACAHLLAMARRSGASVRLGEEVVGIERGASGVRAVRTPSGAIATSAVVNATGVAASATAGLAGVDLPVEPRRGFILVTERLGDVVRHKVYGAGYVAGVVSSDEALQTSAVVESTESGNVLIGASRERVGMDRTISIAVLARLAAQAVAIFPVLRAVRAIRTYAGFRPYCPDHLPIIGPDPRVGGLFHACGHEGAGIGLSTATGLLIAQSVAGNHAEIPLEPFSPVRFGAGLHG